MKHQPHPARRRSAAYTLVEVLLVVTILGIVSVSVIPSMLTAGEMGVQAAARVIVADLLYAQNEAIAQQASHKVVFDVANNSYQIQDQNGTPLTVDWLGGSANNYIVDFANDQRFQGVTITAVDFGVTTPNEISYDNLGGPSTGGSITIQFDRQSYRIDVAEFTGRVTVTQI
ncbi:Tfp pilus assembly protein FimT [Algisphaera agarilytica]|uniref:Type II secretion system protein H n=2 Tax=Algisphaera agarilytica TaxID=1385975 RepID=A0A7X0H659_9BACT|nr:Tfp pilus assembly protein FimT [Algisphaera agarilytica]